MRQSGLNNAQQSEKVRLEHLPSLRFFDFLNSSQHAEPGVVNDNVHVPMNLSSLGYNRTHILGIGHVESEYTQSPGCHLQVGLPITSGTDDGITFCDGGRSQFPAKASRYSGYEPDLWL